MRTMPREKATHRKGAEEDEEKDDDEEEKLDAWFFIRLQ